MGCFEYGSSGNFPQPVLYVSKRKDNIFMSLIENGQSWRKPGEGGKKKKKAF